ncbi:MAG TPA: protein translocase subunit SecD [Anaerolineales bacterium]|nr:protein translocase subunit SecD [Anaerolineales bacterium]
MTRRPYLMLALILVLIAFALWIDLSNQVTIMNPFNQQAIIDRNVSIRLGLDLRGGLQTLLEADLPPDVSVSSDDLGVARQILENRSNALGVSEVIMQVAPPRRIVAEFPGIDNPDEVVASLQKTGLLEFVDMGNERPAPGTVIQTDFGQETSAQPTIIPTTTVSTDTSPTETPVDTPTETPATDVPVIYHTVMTGTALDSVAVTQQTGQYMISFTLKSDSKQLFSDFTGSHVNQILAIVLDKTVISAPSIDSQITDGSGVISGNFTQQSANDLAIQLRYGSLPIPIKVVESRTVGPTLGAESVQKSLFAGLIGLTIVILFMGIYYRLPGFLADLALIVYALLTLMLFKLIPVVLTLPGIAGFILSIGMAVDANILIFERLKEELRAGRTLQQAIDLGWSRAWPSIRDSNFSTLITCGILFWFGNAFGASLVKGFSLTLALGVLVSLFTAITVTRTFLHVTLDNIKSAEHPRWFGL